MSTNTAASPTNIARLNLVSLRLVVVCAEVGAIKRAAPICNMSTMCASRRLRQLEEVLGVPLFYRRHAGLIPTDAGELVAKEGKAILQLMSKLVTSAAEAPQPVRKIFENPGRPKQVAESRVTQ